MRIVADTNTVISGLLWSGAPQQLINAARERRIELFSSPVLIAEFAEVVAREKFAARIKAARLSAAQLVADYARLAYLVAPAELSAAGTLRDPDDAPVLACAIAAGVDAIVSGDKDLRVLTPYQGIPILTPAECLGRIGS